jgi:BlaI family penicillinase repressor
MASKNADPLTPAEWKVMRIVWALESCASRDVYEEAGERYGWSPSTTKTHLRRLVDKGYLSTTRVGNSFLYRPASSAIRSLQRAADRLLENTLDGTKAPLLAYMVKKSRLSADELDALRELLDAYERREER